MTLFSRTLDFLKTPQQLASAANKNYITNKKLSTNQTSLGSLHPEATFLLGFYLNQVAKFAVAVVHGHCRKILLQR